MWVANDQFKKERYPLTNALFWLGNGLLVPLPVCCYKFTLKVRLSWPIEVCNLFLQKCTTKTNWSPENPKQLTNLLLWIYRYIWLIS